MKKIVLWMTVIAILVVAAFLAGGPAWPRKSRGSAF